MTANEFKRELSKLSGTDFFNPKYRELFKKVFPDDKPTDDKTDDGEVENDEARDSLNGDGVKDEKQVEAKEQDVDNAEDERETDKIEKDKAASSEKRDEESEDECEETLEIGKDIGELKGDKTTDMLLEAKIENEFLRGGVREEKLGAAMRLAKSEVKSLDELGKVKEILNDFPEWVRGYQGKGFGMDVDRDSDNLTEEEKRLKQMGIDPRS